MGVGGPAITRVTRFCYSYNPEGRTYVFNILKVTGAGTLFVAVLFTLFLVLRGIRIKKRGDRTNGTR